MLAEGLRAGPGAPGRCRCSSVAPRSFGRSGPTVRSIAVSFRPQMGECCGHGQHRLPHPRPARPARGPPLLARHRARRPPRRLGRARCGATSTGCGSSATRSRRPAASAAATSSAPGSALPPLVLDDDEAVALVVGLHTAADSMVAGRGRVVGARAGQDAVADAAAAARTAPTRCASRPCPAPWRGSDAVIAPEVLDVARARVSRRGARRRSRYTARDGAATERYVEPYRLVVLSRRWYLLAFDVDRDDWRNFRVDRIERPAGDGRAIRSPRDAGGSRRVRPRVDRADAARPRGGRRRRRAGRGRRAADRAVGDGRADRPRRVPGADDRRRPGVARPRARAARRRLHRGRAAGARGAGPRRRRFARPRP